MNEPTTTTTITAYTLLQEEEIYMYNIKHNNDNTIRTKRMEQKIGTRALQKANMRSKLGVICFFLFLVRLIGIFHFIMHILYARVIVTWSSTCRNKRYGSNSLTANERGFFISYYFRSWINYALRPRNVQFHRTIDYAICFRGTQLETRFWIKSNMSMEKICFDWNNYDFD